MNQSTGTPGSNTRPSVEGSGSPALAYTNPQPRLPHSEASPPEQPETFMRRARRVRVGSNRLKLWYLALCTFGRAWTRGEDVLEIGIKQRTLAGELETGLNVVSRTLTELRETGLIQVLRRKYHSTIRIFLTPQGQPDTPLPGVSGPDSVAPDTPLPGVSGPDSVAPDTPLPGVSGDTDAPADTPLPGVSEPSDPLRDAPQAGVSDNPGTPQVGVAGTPQVGVTKVFRSVLDVQQQQHSPSGTRPATEKQLSGIASMAAELGIPVPDPHDRLAADVVFRELRERVDTRRAKRRGKGKSSGPERPHIIEYSKIDRQSRCRVCGAWNPNPRGECGGE